MVNLYRMYKNQPYYVKGNINQKRINTVIYYLFPKMFLPLEKEICVSDKETDKLSNSLYVYTKELLGNFYIMDNWESLCTKNHLYNTLYSDYESLSKIITHKTTTIVFYEIIEIENVLHFLSNKYTSSLHFYDDNTIMPLKYLSTNITDISYVKESMMDINLYLLHKNIKKDLVFCSAYSNDEYHNAIQLLMQFCALVQVQNMDGACIIKYGDSFSQLSLEIIALISMFYEKVFFLKPSVSDLYTCDKYIVCKGFSNKHVTDNTIHIFNELYIQCTNNENIQSIFRNNIPNFVRIKLEEINSIFGQSRLEYIHNIILNEESNTVDNTKHRIEQCMEWCKKHNVVVSS